MKSGKTALILLAGVGAGVAIGYFLSSEKSRKLRKKITDTLNEVSDDVRQKLLDEFAELKEKASDLKDKGASLKDKIAYAMKDLKDDAKQRILDFIENYHDTADSGKKNMSNNSANSNSKQTSTVQ